MATGARTTTCCPWRADGKGAGLVLGADGSQQLQLVAGLDVVLLLLHSGVGGGQCGLMVRQELTSRHGCQTACEHLPSILSDLAILPSLANLLSS